MLVEIQFVPADNLLVPSLVDAMERLADALRAIDRLLRDPPARQRVLDKFGAWNLDVRLPEEPA